MSPRALTLLLSALLCACSVSTTRIQSRALAPAPDRSPDRLIIAAVDSDPAAFLAEAGSTPRGYDNATAYGPTARARTLMHALERDYGLREVSDWPIEPLRMHCAVLRIPDAADRTKLLARMSADRRVRLAQPLQTFSTRSSSASAPVRADSTGTGSSGTGSPGTGSTVSGTTGAGGYNDPYLGLQRGFRQMDVMGAHAWTRGEGVKVGIIDTGADTEHPDLRGRIAAAENFVDADESRFRLDRHGTEMAGVIAAVANNHQGIVGVAPGARILLFKACWQLEVDADAASCNSFTLARALVAALDARVQVVNLSLNGPGDPLLSDLIREGLRRGVVFVGAAGASTHGDDDGLMDQPGIIEVAGAEAGTGRDVAVHAPGREILTLLPGNRYDFASGNSIATAQVTGVVALLLAQKPALTAAEVSKLLRDSSSTAAVRAVAAGTAPVAARGAGVGSAATLEPGTVNACAAVIASIGRGSCPGNAAIER